MPSPLLLTATLAAAGLAGGAWPAAAASTSLPTPGTSRVLLVSAPAAADPLLRQQRAAFEAMRAGARARDLVLVEAIGPTPAADDLRRRFALDPSTFEAVLIGKDGGAKLRSGEVLGPGQLFPVIDAMPMRRREMGR